MSICMIAMPDVCFDHPVPVSERGAIPYLCTEAGAEIVTDWAEKHPKVKVVGWRCGPVTKDA